jgi:hypothetical protein
MTTCESSILEADTSHLDVPALPTAGCNWPLWPSSVCVERGLCILQAAQSNRRIASSDVAAAAAVAAAARQVLPDLLFPAAGNPATAGACASLHLSALQHQDLWQRWKYR